ncbi:MAG: aminotransferase class V-fold PLP-dependent enzyme [Acetobacteraceae bacterium]|nr:aminotransferase class V-fold PLP-dependent enzyme [Acetobacteraceae bacterium]
MMAANNETGVIQPLAEVAALCRQFGALFHVDAAQAPGRLPLREIAACGATSLVLSAHKAGGPKGAGALVLPTGWWPGALIRGGGQERGLRGGTEPLPAIVGFAAALEAAEAWRTAGGAERVARFATRDRAGRAAAGAFGGDYCRARAAAGEHRLPRSARRRCRHPGDGA